MVEIEIMPSARQDIRDIIDYVFNRSVQNAEKLYSEILYKISSLHQYPERGQLVKEVNSPEIREIRVYHFRIIYRVLPNKVQVLTIHHSSRLLSNSPHFKDLFE
jgi:toxin ParE1/3/4